jgi:hypothetical protein
MAKTFPRPFKQEALRQALDHYNRRLQETQETISLLLSYTNAEHMLPANEERAARILDVFSKGT